MSRTALAFFATIVKNFCNDEINLVSLLVTSGFKQFMYSNFLEKLENIWTIFIYVEMQLQPSNSYVLLSGFQTVFIYLQTSFLQIRNYITRYNWIVIGVEVLFES